MSAPITAISSMATRELLSELATAYGERSGRVLTVESVGGVDAARRIQDGEAFDAVFLASDAIDRLIASGHLRPDRVDIARSPVAVAVRAGVPPPAVGTEDQLRRAVLAAPRIGLSTGPSGTHLRRLFERWGLDDAAPARIVQAPPGVPVGSLIARGEVDLGFQQLGELMHLDGIQLLGTLPEGCAIVTTFSASICTGSSQSAAVRDMLAFMTSADAAPAKRRHGMDTA